MKRGIIINIKDFWENRASLNSENPEASWGDTFIMDLENSEVLKLLSHESVHLLDVGCANGYTDFFLLRNKKKISITGIDFSKNMIHAANQIKEKMDDQISKRVKFKEEDILKINTYDYDCLFDYVLCKRVIINLLENHEKEIALNNIHSLLKKDGILILSEASLDSLKNLNKLRKFLRIPILKEPWHNRYIEEKWLKKTIENKYELIKIINFSSTYYLGTRLVYPFLVKNLKFNTKFHKLLTKLPSFLNYGIQKIYVLKKIEVNNEQCIRK